jgi:hypothetical protein
MAKQKHWSVPTSFKVHAERAGEAQQLVEELVQGLLTKTGKSAGLVMIRVHRPERLRAQADTCEACREA